MGDINSHGSTTWTSSKKAKYHHLAPQYQSVESYRHGASASTSLILDNHASSMEHANTSSTASTGSNENSSNEDNTHNGGENEERDLDVDNAEDAAFLVYSLNQPLPPRNSKTTTASSSQFSTSSVTHNNSSSSIASSSCSIGGGSTTLLPTRPASAASVLSASAMMSAVTGVISSTTCLTHTSSSSTCSMGVGVPSSVAEFQSIASVSSQDGPGIVSGISSVQEINAVLAAADLYLGQVVDHPPAWQVMRPVAVGSLTNDNNSQGGLSNKQLRLHQSAAMGNLQQVPVPKILLSIIPPMVPLPAEGGLSPRGVFSPSGGAKSPNGSISSQTSQGPGLTLPSLQIHDGIIPVVLGSQSGSSNHSGSQAGSSCGSGSDVTRLGTSTTNHSNNNSSDGTASGSGSDVDVNDGCSSEKDSMEGAVADTCNIRGGSSLSSGEEGSGRDTPL